MLEFLVGQFGRYRLLEQLGNGGMATVYRAVDESGRAVAVKMVHPALAGDVEARERMRREARVMQAVDVPGVARLLDFSFGGEVSFLVMELIEGHTLEDDVRINGVWPLSDLVDLADNLAGTLGRLHARGLLHRDLKPSNVMLSERGPVLIDFGIAQEFGAERLTSAGMVVGTPSYLSAQVVCGEPAGVRDDEWALVCVLLFCATGRSPFGGDSLSATVARVCSGGVDVVGLDEQLAVLFRSALNPSVDARLPLSRFLGRLGDLGAGRVGVATQSLPVQGGGVQGLPTQTLAAQGIPTQSLPIQGGGVQGLPTQTLTAQGIPTQSLPIQGGGVQGLPTQTLTAQGIPTQSLPIQGGGVQGLPTQTLAAQGIPTQSLPAQGVPGVVSSSASLSVSAPVESVPTAHLPVQAGEIEQKANSWLAEQQAEAGEDSELSGSSGRRFKAPRFRWWRNFMWCFFLFSLCASVPMFLPDWHSWGAKLSLVWALPGAFYLLIGFGGIGRYRLYRAQCNTGREDPSYQALREVSVAGAVGAHVFVSLICALVAVLVQELVSAWVVPPIAHVPVELTYFVDGLVKVALNTVGLSLAYCLLAVLDPIYRLGYNRFSRYLGGYMLFLIGLVLPVIAIALNS